MPQFSANLGFLWTELPLPDAIRAAAKHGFDAVECHWPYEVDAFSVNRALKETGLSMLGLNTRRGNVANGDIGLAALAGREAEARAAIVEAIDYAKATHTGAVHVMAGKAEGRAAHRQFVENLTFATKLAAEAGMTILIEPLNPYDAPGYFLRDTEQARAIISEVGAANMQLMFDCYHVGRTEGDVVGRLEALWPIIGHIQFAAVPDRGEPDHGEVDYSDVFAFIDAAGWQRPLGAEYRPGGTTETSLGWMQSLTNKMAKR